MNISTAQFKGVIDTTLRDGQQSPLLFDTYSYRFTLEDKLTIVKGLAEIGVGMIEFFSPVVSTLEKRDFLSIREYIRKQYPSIKLIAHCRSHPKDVEQAIEAGFDGLNLYMGASSHSRRNSHGLDLDEIKKRVKTIIKQVRSDYPALYIRFSAEDCFRTKLSDVYAIYDEIASYVDTFGMPDTVGIATPDSVRQRVHALKLRYPNVDLECHFHNDRGYSLINAVAAVLSGASYIDTSIWGMAERSGITSVTGLLLNLFQEDTDYCKGYNLELCYPINVLMGSILKYHVPYNEPVSVTNRTHTAGVHQKAVINDKIVYEAMDLGAFGVTRNQLLLGPLSGWNLIYYYIREFKHYDLTEDQARAISSDYKKQAGRIGRMNDPESVLQEVISQYKLQKMSIKTVNVHKRVEQLT